MRKMNDLVEKAINVALSNMHKNFQKKIEQGKNPNEIYFLDLFFEEIFLYGCEVGREKGIKIGLEKSIVEVLKAYPDISPTLVARHFEVSPSKVRRLRAKLNATP